VSVIRDLNATLLTGDIGIRQLLGVMDPERLEMTGDI